MIRVQREPTPQTLIDNADEWALELCEARRLYYVELRRFERREISTRPKTVDAKKSRYANNTVKTALKRMFGTKCCYCEAKVTVVSYQHVEHFRPQSIYPRLAYEWSNLLLACEQCNSTHKGDRFPLGPGEQHAEPDRQTPCSLNGSDTGLLIDPCRDDPADHFEYVFDDRPDDGYIDVVLVCKSRRGELSRDVYGLSRTDLVDDWREHLLGIQNDVAGYQLALQLDNRAKQRRFESYLRRSMASTSPYSALTRAYIQQRGIDL